MSDFGPCGLERLFREYIRHAHGVFDYRPCRANNRCVATGNPIHSGKSTAIFTRKVSARESQLFYISY